jgi:hypothetical protein
VPVRTTGFTLLEEANLFLKHQLVGFVKGAATLAQGKLARIGPLGGSRLVDLAVQDYEGNVTIRPHWAWSELKGFLANFDAKRAHDYIQDGERATWPQIGLIRSLCEVEYCLDEVARKLQRSMRM